MPTHPSGPLHRPAPAEAARGACHFGAPSAPARTLLDVLDATAAAHPRATALDTGAERLDYRTLTAEVAARAELLRRAGAGVGDRIGIRVPSGSAELYLAVLAVLRCGAAYVPVDADDPDERAATVFREAGVCLVLGADGAMAPGAVPPAGAGGAARRAPGPQDDAWIIFTSGSTGAPKGVAVTHRSAAAFVDAEAGLFLPERPLGPGDRVLAGLSVAFDASCEEMWLAWRHGACLVPAPRALVRAGHELGPWLVERGITVVSTVPTLAALWPADCLDRVRLLIVGGEACPAELVDRFAVGGREMWNTYGPTETTVVACAAQLRPGDPVRIGLPLDGWDLAVVDEAGEPVARGAEGELVIAGAGVARYLDPVKDADRFRPCPALGAARAYRTGDLVLADPDGLIFTGRADDQIKLGGRRVELGEIDAALSALPGVLGAAAAVHTTPAGGQVLAGYVVPAPGYDRARAREALARGLPAALVPVLAEIAELPTRTSGKVDRDALPWPLPGAAEPEPSGLPDATGREPLGPAEARLADVWAELLGTRPGPGSDFVALGGTSLTAARMASVLRERHPGVSVADLYRHPVLRDMAAHLAGLAPAADPSRSGSASSASSSAPSFSGEPVPRTAPPLRRRTGAAQILVQCALFGVTGLRGLVGLAAIDNVLAVLAPKAWTPYTSWWLVLAGWVVLFSAPSRFALGAAAARLLTRGITPGAHPRGGRVHLRLWAAERTVAAFGVPALLGTPWAAWYARSLGCTTGRDVALHAMPPVTGLAELGDGCAVEPEADLSGWWIDGATLRVGAVRVGAGARVGHRSMLMPGAVVGPGAELAGGACLDGEIPAGADWEGSPARPAAHQRPRPFAPEPFAPEAYEPYEPFAPEPTARVRGGRWKTAYAVSLGVLPLLPLVAAAPALVGTYYLIKECVTLGAVAWWLLLTVPVSTCVTTLGWILTVAAVVRLLGRGITPGDHPADGGVAWRVWLVHRLLGGARASLFPLYAGLATPLWLRLLGARVGRRTEISTVLTLPSLLTVEDGAFLADDVLAAPYELRGGRMRLGAVRIGRRAFVGNSGIVGPGRTVPDHALIGVLSDAPRRSEPGTSWLGRPTMPLPRVADTPDAGRTFEPAAPLVLARGLVELCRLVPLMCGLALAEGVLLAQQNALDSGGLWLAALVGAPLLLAAGVAAALTATAAKWMLVGRFRVTERPLWSSFVWRNELYDTFVESLAVPWLAGPFTGTPVLNWWLRSLGARIGRGVWCDTHWLPETDLIALGAGATVNRGCVLQTHLFHDRIMRMDTVDLAEGASLGPHSIVLPGSAVGAHASVGASSLVMRGETVPPATHWAGNPIAGAAAPAIE
ncbi:amino acid adenylation domain-containing protein [Streptomyces sp. NBC_00536]|uniref:Pls/PosA family non-ribosomal peptide synthetase n=1 Tax=Streptomyces sp. NBC_00536 TaxID=2975769 RepID=UPI002E81276F|nr:Pls/PosA family non-ribosomal peptide synthetase [Streptomyces sp. NBC_00536]WUC77876.1 amino acid adenylation domain-containing protein [Streptomyces sp. NBC_00536]